MDGVDIQLPVDLVAALTTLMLLGGIILVYSINILLRGRLRFERVERQGGSALFGKRAMEMGYWTLLPLARLLFRLRLSPDTISWSSLAFGALAGFCLGLGFFGFGAACAVLAGFADVLDGMVARMCNKNDLAGTVLDSALDRYVDFFLLAGIAFHYRSWPLLLAIALFAILGSFMISYSTAKAEALHVEPPRGNMKRSERVAYLIFGALFSALSVPLVESRFEITQNVGVPMLLSVTLIAILANVSAARRLAAVARSAARAQATTPLQRRKDQTATQAYEDVS